MIINVISSSINSIVYFANDYYWEGVFALLWCVLTVSYWDNLLLGRRICALVVRVDGEKQRLSLLGRSVCALVMRADGEELG